MAEPSTTTVAASALMVGIASLAPGIDGNALIGAFTGAALVVVTSRDIGVLKRLAYMLISLVMGYMAAPEIVANTFVKSTGVSAFFAAALVIALTLTLIERVKSADLLSILKRGE